MSASVRPTLSPELEETLEKIAASRSTRQRDAVVINYGHRHELEHKLRTYEVLKVKAGKAIDYQQRKFLQSLSSSQEDMDRAVDDKLPRILLQKEGANDEVEDLAQLVNEGEQLVEIPRGRRSHVENRIERSVSEFDLMHLNVDADPTRRKEAGGHLLPLPLIQRSRTFSGGPLPAKIQKANRNAARHRNPSVSSVDSAPEETTAGQSSENPQAYSISCSMKIADSRGAFESWTGKAGLKAWMGKTSPQLPKRKTTEVKPKIP